MKLLKRLISWWRRDYLVEELVREYRQSFPGRCLICAYHNYGLQHGMANGVPSNHFCIDPKSPWHKECHNGPHPLPDTPATQDKEEG